MTDESSVGAAAAVAPRQPEGESRGAWRKYWIALSQPWRTEPEIDDERRQFLAERQAITPNIGQDVYPFKGVALARADVEWLLAAHDGGRGPVDWSDAAQRERVGLDLRGADLRGANLRALPLARLIGGLAGATEKQREVAGVRLDGADLRYAHLEGADLREAQLANALCEKAQLQSAQLAKAFLRRTNLRGAHLEGADLRDARMEKAEFFGAWLEDANLSGARLQGASLTEAHLEGASLGGSRLEGAFLRRAHLEGAKLYGAHLENASLVEAQLAGAFLRRVHFEGASLAQAHCAGKRLAEDDLRRVRQWKPEFPAVLPPADFSLAFFDAGTVLQGIVLGDQTSGFVSLADVRWGNVNLAVVRWRRDRRGRIIPLGDEAEARRARGADGTSKPQRQRLAEYETAVRANRQLALALQAQGLNEDAARYAYRAQVLQRGVLRRQGKVGAYLFSLFLDGLAGYGYQPGRSVVAYVLMLAGFTVAYYAIGQAYGPRLSVPGALVFSVTSFHGRGFFPGNVTVDSPLTELAAFEALVGLLIELSFIATFTQRFFGK